jgi:hypothetical protein
MDDKTQKRVERVLELLARVKSYRCRYYDISFQSDVDARRIVEIRGDSNGRVRLDTIAGRPKVETLITPEMLVRVDRTARTGYRIDFSRHPFSDFHRYGWLCVNRPFSLFDIGTLSFRTEIAEAPQVLVFQGGLSPELLPKRSPENGAPSAQFKIDSRSGLLRELLIVSGGSPQRFLFTDFVVNKRIREADILLDGGNEVGDMTELYWNQIQGAQDGSDPPPPFFSWN